MMRATSTRDHLQSTVYRLLTAGYWLLATG